MYSQRELRRLALSKVSLRRKISLRRTACSQAAARLARPLAWFDRVIAFAQRLSPLAQLVAWPVGLLVQRAVPPRLKWLAPILRWAPHLLGALRSRCSRVKG
jgi:hypothetical protein